MDWDKLEKKPPTYELDKAVRKMSYNIGAGSHWIRPVGKPIKIHKGWDGSRYFTVRSSDPPLPVGQKVNERMATWAFIRNPNITTPPSCSNAGYLLSPSINAQVVELPPTIVRMINSECKKNKIHDPCDINGLSFNITRTGQNINTRYNLVSSVVDTLTKEEIEYVDKLVPLQVLYYGDIRGDINQPQVVKASVYSAECPECDGNGYFSEDGSVKQCERCKGEGTLYF